MRHKVLSFSISNVKVVSYLLSSGELECKLMKEPSSKLTTMLSEVIKNKTVTPLNKTFLIMMTDKKPAASAVLCYASCSS